VEAIGFRRRCYWTNSRRGISAPATAWRAIAAAVNRPLALKTLLPKGRPFILRRLTGQLPSLAGNVVAGGEIRGSGLIIGSPSLTIMEGSPVTRELNVSWDHPVRLPFPAELAVLEVKCNLPELKPPNAQNAVKIVSFIFPVIYDKPNLRADVLFA